MMIATKLSFDNNFHLNFKLLSQKRLCHAKLVIQYVIINLPLLKRLCQINFSCHMQNIFELFIIMLYSCPLNNHQNRSNTDIPKMMHMFHFTVCFQSTALFNLIRPQCRYSTDSKGYKMSKNMTSSNVTHQYVLHAIYIITYFLSTFLSTPGVWCQGRNL